jgi:hypothetical protein
MKNHVPAMLMLVAAVACGPTEQPAQTPNTPANEAPGGSGTGTPPAEKTDKPASAPGVNLRADAGVGSHAGSRSATAPAAPAMVELSVPLGTQLVLKLENAVSSETAQPEQAIRATVVKPIVVDGTVVIPEGASVKGTVIAAQRSGRVKGVATLTLGFNEVTVAKTPYTINTSRIARAAEATKGEDATKIGIGAGVGTAIGAIAGGKKGAAIGAGIGGGAGAGAVLATRGKEVTIPAGATLRTTIQESVTITVPAKGL